MLKDCITDSTKMMEIRVDSLPDLNDENYDYYETIAGNKTKERKQDIAS